MDASRAHPFWLAQRLLWFRRDRQKGKEAREGLRGEPPFGGLSSFAGLGVPFLSGHVADLCGFSHGVNQSSEAKKASLLPALFPSWWRTSCIYSAPLSS